MVVLVCAWCKEKMKIGPKWEKLDQVTLEVEGTIISHGLCLTCYEGLQENLKQPLRQPDSEALLNETRIA